MYSNIYIPSHFTQQLCNYANSDFQILKRIPKIFCMFYKDFLRFHLLSVFPMARACIHAIIFFNNNKFECLYSAFSKHMLKALYKDKGAIQRNTLVPGLEPRTRGHDEACTLSTVPPEHRYLYIYCTHWRIQGGQYGHGPPQKAWRGPTCPLAPPKRAIS